MAELIIEIQASPGVRMPPADRLQALLEFAAEQEGAGGEVSVWICRDGEIAELHERYQGIPGPTDVLSFPGEPPYLGDIAVSADTAAAQAAEVGHSPGREIAYLALHGLLHLLGYDDLDETSRARMLARQDELLEAFEREYLGEWDEPAGR
uniref:Endoribonuclease YbeY n=1 Tax=Thermorudis peleae TaxID=1382356 RepID=A0A831T7F7_9BACT